MADSWQVSPPLQPSDTSSRFHVSLPGRSGDQNVLQYSWKRRREPPKLLSLYANKLPPVQSSGLAVIAEPEAIVAPQPPFSPSAEKTRVQEVRERALPALTQGHQGELPKFAVPSPPPKPRNGAVRPARQHERLHGGHARGMTSRAAVHVGFAGCKSDIGAPARWGTMKVLYTELVEAINGVSIPALAHSVAQAQVLGAVGWPEYSVAMTRLNVLRSLYSELELVATSTDPDAIERVLADAAALKVGPGSTGDKLWSIRDLVESRLNILRRLEQDLSQAGRGTSILQLSGLLRSAQELGVAHWPMAADADCRLRSLKRLLTQLGNATNSSSYEELRDAVSSAAVMGVLEDADAPLGFTLTAARQKMLLLEAQNRELSTFDCIDTKLATLANGADVAALRCAVAEAEIALTRGFVIFADKTNWQALAWARDRLALLAALEVELLAVQNTTLTDNLVAAIARADTLGCSSWQSIKMANERLRQIRTAESELLQAVSESSAVLLEEAVANAESQGLSSWPHARTARRLLQVLQGADEQQREQVMKRFMADLSARLTRCSTSVHEQQSLLHAGLLVYMNEDTGQVDDRALQKDLASGLYAALHVEVDVVRIFHIEPCILVAELLMCPRAPDSSEALHCLYEQFTTQDSTSLLENDSFGQSVCKRVQILHAQVVDKLAARALKRHGGPGLPSVASTDSRCSAVSGSMSDDSYTLNDWSTECCRQLVSDICSESGFGHFISKEWSESSGSNRSLTPSAADVLEGLVHSACTAIANDDLSDGRRSLGSSCSGRSATLVQEVRTLSPESIYESVAGDAIKDLLDTALSKEILPSAQDDSRNTPRIEASAVRKKAKATLIGASKNGTLRTALGSRPAVAADAAMTEEALAVTSELLASALEHLARDESPADAGNALLGIVTNLRSIPYGTLLAQTPSAWSNAASLDGLARNALNQALENVTRDESQDNASLVSSTAAFNDSVADEVAHNLVLKLLEDSSGHAQPTSASAPQGELVDQTARDRSLGDMALVVRGALETVPPEDLSVVLDAESTIPESAIEQMAQNITLQVADTLFEHAAGNLAACQFSEVSLAQVVGEDLARALVLDAAEDHSGASKTISMAILTDSSASLIDEDTAMEAVLQVSSFACKQIAEPSDGGTVVSMSAADDDAITQTSNRGADISSMLGHTVIEEGSGSEAIRDALSSAIAEHIAGSAVSDVASPVAESGLKRDASDAVLSGVSSFGGGALARLLVNDASAAAVGKPALRELAEVEPNMISDVATSVAAVRQTAVPELVEAEPSMMSDVATSAAAVGTPAVPELAEAEPSMISDVATSAAALWKPAVPKFVETEPSEIISDFEATDIGFFHEQVAATISFAAQNAIRELAESPAELVKSPSPDQQNGAPVSAVALARAVAIAAVRASVRKAFGLPPAVTGAASAEHVPSQDAMLAAVWSFAEMHVSHLPHPATISHKALVGSTVCDILAAAVGHLAWRRISEAALSNILGGREAAKSQVQAAILERKRYSSSEAASWTSNAAFAVQRLSPDSVVTEINSQLGRDVAQHAVTAASNSCAQSAFSKILSTSAGGELAGNTDMTSASEA